MVLSVVDIITGILKNPTVMITVISFAATFLMRTGYKIYNEGKRDKAEVVTRKELLLFEQKMRSDMRGYKDEIFTSIWELCKTSIQGEIKDVEKIKKLATEVQLLAVKYDEKLEHNLKALNDVSDMSKLLYQMDRRLTRIEYGEPKTASSTRRTDDSDK